MKPNPRPRRLVAATVGVATTLAAAMLTVPVAAQPRAEGSGTAPGASDPGVYVVGDRVVAIRRDPMPPGAYGNHGVDYAPHLRAWVLDSGCGDAGTVRAH